MESSRQELTLDESIKQMMETLPPVIRAYLAQGKYTPVAKTLMAKYGLRIDQAGVLEREIMLLLMGIENPDEFIQALMEEAKLDKKVIDGIVQDVNTQIFIPLRQEEMKSAQTKRETLVPIPPAGVLRTNVPSAAGTESHFHLENKIPLRPAPSPISPPVVPSPKIVGSAQHPVMIGTSKPINSNTLLEDHKEPHIEFGKTPALSSPVPMRTIPPAAQFPMKNEMPRSTPSANLPGAMPSGVIPVGGRPSFTVPQKIVSPAKPFVSVPQGNAAGAPVAPPVPSTSSKPYATDPYREPIE